MSSSSSGASELALEAVMPHLSRLTTLVLAAAMVAFVALGDRITGVDVAFTLLYLVPIALGAWHGLRYGAALAVLAAACSLANALLEEKPALITIWNELGLLIVFLLIAYLLARHRAHLEQERSQHQLTVDQLRHADRLNVIGTLAAGVAHEIGTPLNVISGSAELLPGAKDPRELEEMSHIIRDQTHKISAIIRHLLDFGRRAGTKTTVLDLDELARSSTTLLIPMARKRSINVVVEPSIAAVLVDGSRAELEQVLSNLVLNAIQAIPHGGTVTIRVGTASRGDGHGARAFGTLSVEDTGPGIDAEALPHIFEPFFTTKGVGEGTGLGLSVSYGIVRDHGGSIEVDSAPGRGARFTVLLPLDTQSPARTPTPPRGAPTAPRGAPTAPRGAATAARRDDTE
ncbi:MAG TPA: ATP-binding protein [Kofleriaceae bacterium]|nr:ATP-binding protein [Kofleriaceae bacterium]